MTSFVRASAPSNIAFIKYWGKRDEGQQWPANDSLSMSLNAARTVTAAALSRAPEHELVIDGKVFSRQSVTGAKVFAHLDRLRIILEADGTLQIQSRNYFPMGAGIASSASGLAALTIAASAAWTDSSSFEELGALGLDRSRLADIARQGSGSAGRSLFGGFVHWQAGANHLSQSIYPLAIDWPLMDVIAIFSDVEKSVNSTTAHRAAWSSPLFASRLAILPERLATLSAALQARNLQKLGPILEQEALEMHAVIMSAKPAIFYLNQQVGDFLADLRRERLNSGLAAYFTIDAGSTVHLICEAHTLPALHSWLQAKWPQTKLITDRLGDGPSLERCQGQEIRLDQ